MFEIPEVIGQYKFIKRINRYTGVVSKQSTTETVFIANTGKLTELLVKDAPAYIKEGEKNPKRKTQYDLLAIEHGKTIVCIDTRVPNWIFEDQLKNNEIKELEGFEIKKREYKIANSKFDYYLENEGEKCLAELKLCTLVQNQKMFFPDAVSERSSRHLNDLVSARKQGYRAIVYFVGLRGDPTSFGPNKELDPAFNEAFEHALKESVEILAVKTSIKYENHNLIFSEFESVPIKP